jgi:DNA-directed RNA polymerase subunit RPC12/RpoP
MIVTVSGPASLAEYVNVQERLIVERPGQCPGCSSRRLWRHTGYKRAAKELEGTAKPVMIQRFRCAECWKVISCLFAFLIPYVQYTAEAVADWLGRYVERPATTYEELGWNGPINQKSTAFRKVAVLCSGSEELLSEVQTEAMLNRAEHVEMERRRSNCPNAERAQTEGKKAQLDSSASLLAFCRQLMRGVGLTGKEILIQLNRYFRLSAEELRSILSGRKGLEMSIQQRMERTLF